MSKRLLAVLASFGILAAAAGTAFAYRVTLKETLVAVRRPALPTAKPYVPLPVSATATAPVPKPSTKPVPKPEPAEPGVTETNLAIPFTSQAPHANWSLPYQEACEEASLIMAGAYFKSETSLAPDEADRRILELVKWETETLGFYEDTTVEEVARIAREYFKMKDVKTKAVASIDEVKTEVAAGRVVILPAAGRLLKNPYFTGEGPKYHMLVVKGFTKDGKIITNDPGTRHGADYLYDPATLYNALHDWNGGDVENGAKTMLSIGG